jgi:uncharacterized protein (DUF433 family)/DNA-binding transcriptional MerR regulator
MARNGFGVGLYTPKVASRVARIRYQNFQAWAKANLTHAARKPVGRKRLESVYSFYDLLLIRLIVRLKSQGAKPRQIRTALDTVDLMSGGESHAWLRATILYDAEAKVVVAVLAQRSDWNPIAASKGTQKMAVVFFPDLIDELKDELVPPGRFPYIEIDPEVLGGAPVIKGTRISTKAVVSVLESGAEPRRAYPTLSGEQVANAQAYEKFLADI